MEDVMDDIGVFRQAKQEDLSEIVRLLAEDALGKERELFTSEIGARYQKAFDEITADQNQLLMVIEKEGRILGTCHLTLIPSLTFQGSKRMNIEAVRIDQSLRGQGAGKWMIHRAIQIAQKEHCKIVQLTTNKKRADAKRFYEALGFEATHEGMKMYL